MMKNATVINETTYKRKRKKRDGFCGKEIGLRIFTNARDTVHKRIGIRNRKYTEPSEYSTGSKIKISSRNNIPIRIMGEWKYKNIPPLMAVRRIRISENSCGLIFISTPKQLQLALKPVRALYC
jgi:hypothetical protein